MLGFATLARGVLLDGRPEVFDLVLWVLAASRTGATASRCPDF